MGADGRILAIVGSRKFDDYDFICQKIHENVDINIVKEIISGGAIGVDTCGKRFADDNGIPIVVKKPDYKKYKDHPKYAPIARNREIADYCDTMIAFYYDDSNGTKDAMTYAESIGRNVIKINLHEEYNKCQD